MITKQGWRCIDANYTTGNSTAVTTYHVKDGHRCIWFTGTFKECENYINQIELTPPKEQ